MVGTRTSRHLVTLGEFEKFLQRHEPLLVTREITATTNLLVDFCNFRSATHTSGGLQMHCAECGTERSNCTNPRHWSYAASVQVDVDALLQLVDDTPLGWMPHVGPARLDRIKRWLAEVTESARKVTDDTP